ncbi:hypothetical protein [Allorhodopirellula solitaria]|uniref:Uncharacterized protein n=1 Tax=Allorhodopirellula solitaria TaxID=2527987 RepID=A0A5C5XPU0_9BACT|nr:hypothetical protein [Allorhodopirellula solitaria]TWT64698.1 hypothetical protein CA85_38310 [Allorhodopirellula solitaria]
MCSAVSILAARRYRCQAMGIDLNGASESCRAAVDHKTPLVAIVCSRVGHDPHRHRSLSQQIAASLEQARRDAATVLVADGTAIDPWLTHAAAVFQVPVIRVESSTGRDRQVIAIADRVDAAYVRQGGKVTELLRMRSRLQSGIVRVAIDGVANGSQRRDRQAVWELLDAGAVGRYLPAEEVGESERGDEAPLGVDRPSIAWSEFLVHCTRAAAGPWPGQTWAKYRDDLLFANPASAARDAIDALCRIVRGQRLVAGAVTSERTEPVVCFSAVELPRLLAGRAYRSHLHRWDYEPYGIAIKRDAASRLGVQPVIYGDRELRNELDLDQRFRFQSVGTTYDWTSEQEWRCGADMDLSRLGKSEVFIFVPDENSARRVGSCNPAMWPIVRLDQFPAAEKPV